MTEFEAMDRYQDFTNTTCQYPNHTHAISVTLGLLGEAGEFAEKMALIADDTIQREREKDTALGKLHLTDVQAAPSQPVAALMQVYSVLQDSISAGRQSEAYKKAIRNKTLAPAPLRELTSDEKQALAKELGDIQWYVAQAARALGYKLSTIAEMNADKLRSRLARGTIKGSGDER